MLNYFDELNQIHSLMRSLVIYQDNDSPEIHKKVSELRESLYLEQSDLNPLVSTYNHSLRNDS